MALEGFIAVASAVGTNVKLSIKLQHQILIDKVVCMKLTILTIVTLVIQLGIALLPMFGKLSDETKPLTKRLTTLGKVIASLSIVALILTITQNIITKQEDDEKDNLRQNELLSLRKTLKDSTKLTVIKGFDPSVTLEEYKIDSIKNGKIYGSYMIFCRYAKATKISLSLETIYVENRDSDYLPEFHTLLNFFPEAMTNKAVLEQDQGMERSFSYDSFPSTCN